MALTACQILSPSQKNRTLYVMHSYFYFRPNSFVDAQDAKLKCPNQN